MRDIMPTIPPLGEDSNAGRILKKVIKVVKGVWNFISGFAKDGSDTDSINDDSSLDNIDRITEIFSNFKEQVQIKSIEIEKNITDEVIFYLDEIKQMLEDNQDVSEKYGIKVTRIERKIDRIIPHLCGVIDHELSKRISLDNSDCKNIMKMIPGEKKEKALSNFLNESISQALVACCTNLKEKLDEVFEAVTDEIVGVVEAIQKNSELQLKKIDEIDAENYAEKTTHLMSDAYYIMDVCELIEEIMAEA